MLVQMLDQMSERLLALQSEDKLSVVWSDLQWEQMSAPR
jgi:hypothetical protein